jgi:cold shock CspA family protein
MKKRNNIKKRVKNIKKSDDSMGNKRRKQSEPDLWKEIRSNLKPIGKAYNKFIEKRRISKQKEEERRLKENEKQRVIEEESLRLQDQEEKRFKKGENLKKEKERRLQAQEKQRLEEKRIIEDRNERISQEQIYKERLIKGEEERLVQLKRVSELREEERKLIGERNLKNERSFAVKQGIKDEEQQILRKEEQILKKEEQRLKEEEQRLKEEEQRLKEKEQRLKEEEQRIKEEKRLELEQRLKEEEKINLKEIRKFDDEQKKKRLNGTVKWFSDAKGYGFIIREDKEKDIFVHFSAVKNSGLKFLKESEQLTFEVENSDKGLSAVNLQRSVNDVFGAHLKVVK